MNDSPPPGFKKAIVFVAFGTRGDVQPLATLAEHIRRSVHYNDWEPQLVTHRAHAHWLHTEPYQLLHASFLNTSPFGAGHRAQNRMPDCPKSEDVQLESTHKEQLLLLDKIISIRNLSVVVFNLFALEVSHISQVLIGMDRCNTWYTDVLLFAMERCDTW
jgi:hypothetical protein